MSRNRLIPYVLATLLIVAGCARSDTQSQPQAGDKSPNKATSQTQLALGGTIPMSDHPMKNVDGSMTSIAAVKGEKGTLVIFTCNHCPYVKAWQDRTVAIANQAVKDGFGVIAINPNDPAAYSEDDFEGMVIRARSMKMNYPYVVDATSDVGRAFSATKTPEIFLFDSDNRLIYHGAVDDNAQNASAVSEHYLQNALEAAKAGNPIVKPETRSVGCSIKFRAVRSGS
ncbi:MAG: thioredoxin family protein [bacterium]